MNEWASGTTMYSDFEPMSEWTYHIMWKWANERMYIPYIVILSQWMNGPII